MEQMTPEQAIRVIKIIQSKYDGLKSYKDCFDALNIAISALEKQVPKKPIPNKRGYYDCPNCGINMEVILDEVSEPDSCFTCGQALDWSE